MPDWESLAEHLRGFDEVEFVIAPTKRFVGEPGEQATMFFLDPFGNPIEIKGFADWESVYAK
jgi:extradiol dioxygenase family protein